MPFLPILTSAQIRTMEQAALAQGQPLMERAGAAAAALARQLLADLPRTPGRSALVVAGPGNNGGDAFECAVRLKRDWFRVTVAFAGDRDRLPPDARAALGRWEAAGGTLESDIPEQGHWDLIIDGLFGMGLSRPLRGRHAEWVARINALDAPVLALDVPSGLNADTGAVMGDAVRAAHTLTFIARKPGLLTLDGPDRCGILHCDELGLSTTPDASQPPPGFLLDAGVLRGAPRRPRNFHKGLAGDVGVLGGAEGMVGAALLAARAALRMGSGRVFVGFLAKHAPAVDFTHPELMMRDPARVLAECPVLVLGPGMGSSDDAGELLQAALSRTFSGRQTLVLDADALNLIGAHEALAALAAEHDGPMVMTPHPAEAGRLLGVETAEVQRDRLAAALALARRYRCLILLKGNGSVLAEPSGGWCINPSGNPGMASAGMGDALAGMLASLLAQRLPPARALQLAVWTHGAAADELAAMGRGPLGITASDVITQAAALLNRALTPTPQEEQR